MYEYIKRNQYDKPSLFKLNEELCKELNISVDFMKSEEGINLFSGNESKFSTGIAQAYCGHQYGHLGKLGDGRALLVGEYVHNGERYDFHLKGSGPTSYSRRGDGVAALNSMLREYLISEAMHALGVKTTRSLAILKSGESVRRQQIYDGAVLTRVASSHIRVGTFQYALIFGENNELKELADYTIKRHYPKILDEKNKYLLLLREVIKNQASLIAKWQSLGFVHGVMNTDNVLVCGETIDYGPCAFMDVYDPNVVFSSIDTYGRYAYKNQPSIGAWNMARFAETLIPLLDDDDQVALDLAIKEVEKFEDYYRMEYFDLIKEKLGLEKVNEELIKDLLVAMYENKLDYTNTFRQLSSDETVPSLLEWKRNWKEVLNGQNVLYEDALVKMKKVNPVVIPRNYWVEESLKNADQQDMTLFNEFYNQLKNPYDYSNVKSKFLNEPYELKSKYLTYCNT
jgi:uncharacterized protein YdiU (UPF0061 family)